MLSYLKYSNVNGINKTYISEFLYEARCSDSHLQQRKIRKLFHNRQKSFLKRAYDVNSGGRYFVYINVIMKNLNLQKGTI